jgi:hypothetical protein
MKRVVIGICLVLMTAAGVGLILGRAQESGVPGQQTPSKNEAAANPLKIALLKWYQANLTTSFKVGHQPVGVAFDGANIWVTNNDDATVSKLRASDGATLGTFTVGNEPMGVAFDGANIWVANSFDNTVTKLQAGDGKTLGTFPVGKVPLFPAFDGESIWVTNSQDASITKLRPSDGKTLGTFAHSGAPGGILFDGTYVWVTNANRTVTRFDPTGKQAGTFNVGGAPLNMAFDGTNIWVANSTNGNVTKLRTSDGKVLGTYSTGGVVGPYGIAFDGRNLWIGGGSYIVEMRLDGSLILQDHLEGNLGCVGFDGANIWAVSSKVGSPSVVYKL